MIAPAQAMLFLQEVRHRLTLVRLDEMEYYAAIEQLAGLRLAGGRVYDALLLRCAEKAKADTIYTWNLKHFQHVVPHMADRIKTPGLL